MSNGMSGWKALGFKTYQEYLLSDLWDSKRKLMLELFEKKGCYFCKSKINLQVHHKTYENVGNEKMRDLILICKRCHEKINKEEVENGVY